MKKLKVIIVGTGGAGLAAARELGSSDFEVIMLEKNDRVGGRAATVKWHGFNLEIGASILTSQDKPVLDYVDKFNLGLEDAPGGLNITIPKDGKLHTANFLNPFSLLAWKSLSLKARLSILKLIPPILARSVELKGDTYHMEKGSNKGDDESFAQHFNRKINPELMEECFYPMMETMMGYEKEDLSWKAFLSFMASYMGGKAMAIKGGMGQLTKKLAEGLNIKLGADVKKIWISNDANTTKVKYVQNGETHEIGCDRVIVAVPGNKIFGLIEAGQVRPAWETMFSEIRYSSGAMQYLLLDTRFRPDIPMVYLPVSTGHTINQISFEGHDEDHLLAMTDPRIGSDWQNRSDEELAQRSMEVIAEYFPELEGTLEDQIIFRWNSLVPTLHAGYLSKLAEFKKDPQENPVYFCGDWHNSPNLAGAMTSGIEAAERLKSELG